VPASTTSADEFLDFLGISKMAQDVLGHHRCGGVDNLAEPRGLQPGRGRADWRETVMRSVLRLAVLGVGLALGTSAPTNAAVIINVTQVGGDVVFSATGSLNLTGAAAAGSYLNYDNGVIAGGANWWVAPGPGGATDTYALTTFDSSFGTSAVFYSSPTSVSGDNFFIWGQGGATENVGVAAGYVSGNAITSGMVFGGTTIAGLDLVPGTYLFTLPNDTITLNIGGAVPEPASLLLLVGGLTAAAVRRRRRL
jgi:hypothetical protein